MSDEHDDRQADRDEDRLDTLIARADLDGLVRLVDESCAARDWAGLRRLRDRSLAALDTGRQLWPAATLAEYRLALWAPAEWAATMLDESSGRFTIGPLTEVVAQHHTFTDLLPHLPGGPRTGFVAHERVLRGEAIDPATVEHLPDVLELPYALCDWEPQHPLATYSDAGVDAPAPALPARSAFVELELPASVVRLHDDDVEPVDHALRQLVEPWTAGSNGRAEVAGVEGGVAEAVRALGMRRARAARLEPAAALAWLSWAGASGGAHARRRGAALGRFGSWWTLAAVTGVEHEAGGRLADAADALGEVLAAWEWWWFDGGEPSLGWSLQLAAVDPDDGVAFALSAHDAR